MGEAGRGKTRVRCGTGCSGFCAPVLPGTICLLAIRPIKLVIAASNSGSVPGCSPVCCRNWPKTYATAASWI